MVTLAAWVQSWIESRSIRLAPSTVSGYNGLLRKYITPSPTGLIPIDEVAPEDLIILLSPIIAAGHTRAAQLTQVLVGAALHDAVRQRAIAWNPMDAIDRVHHRKKYTSWLTIDQARDLLTSARAASDPYYVAWLLGLCCGLRRGEILGLMWVDIDLTCAVIHVRRQRVRVDGSIIEAAPKTDASIRDIPLAPQLADALRSCRKPEARYVLETSGGKPVSDKQLQNALRRALARADLPPITLHGLRHSMAATAATEGIPIKVLQSIMGHAQYSTTADIYAHVDKAAIRAAANVISIATLAGKMENGARLEIV